MTQSVDLATPTNWYPGFALTLLACVVGGLVGGIVVHVGHPMFAYTDLPPLELGSPPELVQQHHDAAREYRSRNYAVEFAIIGLTLGLSFGAVSGLPRRFTSILIGGVVGGLCGAGLGFLGGLFVAKTLLLNAQQTLQTSMGLQTLVWGFILANIVWAVAAVRVGPLRAAKYWLIGLIAGFSVAVTQFVISSIMFPTSNPLFLIPELASERVYWLALFPIVSGLILALGFSRLRPAPKLPV